MRYNQIKIGGKSGRGCYLSREAENELDGVFLSGTLAVGGGLFRVGLDDAGRVNTGGIDVDECAGGGGVRSHAEGRWEGGTDGALGENNQ